MHVPFSWYHPRYKLFLVIYHQIHVANIVAWLKYDIVHVHKNIDGLETWNKFCYKTGYIRLDWCKKNLVPNLNQNHHKKIKYYRQWRIMY